MKLSLKTSSAMDTKQSELVALANLHNVDVLGKVGLAAAKIEVKCRNCQIRWSDRFANFKAGNWCKTCQASFDRTMIETILRKYDPINFHSQPKIEEAPELNFDYYIEHGDIGIYIDIIHANNKLLTKKAEVIADIGMKYLHIDPNLILKPDELDQLILKAISSRDSFITSQSNIILTPPTPAQLEDVPRYQFSGVLAQMPYDQTVQLMMNRGELQQLGQSSYTTQELMSPSPQTASFLVYCRISTLAQVIDHYSLADQLNRAVETIKLERGHVRAAYYDLGLSGTKADRPGLTAAIDNIKPGERLVVATLSRFARNTKDAVIMNDLLKTKGARLKILEYNIDTSTPIGEMILAALASFESQQTAERVSSVMQKMAHDGNLVTKPRFGWKIPDRNKKGQPHVEDAQQQATIQYIRELKTTQPLLSIRLICETLDASEAHCRDPADRSKKWHYNTLRRVLEDNNIPIHPGDKTDL